LAQRLIELHGGKLNIESVPGQGTTVTVFLAPERVLS
jgi:signal transduction histidine kinase